MGKGGDEKGDDVENKCPFASGSGYSTHQSRREYLDIMCHSADSSKSDPRPPKSLEADLDTTKPLYFWQLHSLIGRQPVLDICRDFYDFVYLDFESPWFRRVFEEVAPKKHHILAQAAYWVDAMGGGRVYHGGLGRLNYHHRYNAKEIMHAKGAARWMHHMKKSLRKNNRHFQSDPRILPCIVEFLETKMKIYAKVHEWEFDASDFQIEEFSSQEEEQFTDLNKDSSGSGNVARTPLGTVYDDDSSDE
jgi:hypothetical protein